MLGVNGGRTGLSNFKFEKERLGLCLVSNVGLGDSAMVLGTAGGSLNCSSRLNEHDPSSMHALVLFCCGHQHSARPAPGRQNHFEQDPKLLIRPRFHLFRL